MDKEIFTKKELEHVYDFFPALYNLNGGYGISVKLPEKYNDYAKHIWKYKKFRENVEKNLEGSLIKGSDIQELILSWSDKGASFEVLPGVNGCSVYITSTPGGYCYYNHNIDTSHQASVLYNALSLYLNNLYKLLRFVKLEDLSKLEEPEPNSLFKKLRINIPLKYE